MLRNHAWSGARRTLRVPRRLVELTAAALLVIACQQGCAVLGDRPELHPDKWAPPRADREWIAPPATIRQFKISDGGVDDEQHASATIEARREYDLPRLIDIALLNNPET